jgi:signal transduction histidine kinase/ActR/RegA family two-component response regulator
MKSAKLIGKVLVGFLLTGAALSVAILFMYRSIHDVSTAVDEAGKPNERLEEWKTTVNLLYEAENKARNLRILNERELKNERELNAFDSIRTEQTMHLSRLYDLNEDSLQGLILCDSLRVLSAERFEVLADWIRFASIENNENSVLDAILVEMAQREKTVSRENVQRTETVSAEDQNTKVVATDNEKSFWQRLVNRRNKSTYEPVAVVALDSTRNFDSLVPVVGTKELRKTIQSGQIRIETKADSLLREESRLLKADQQIMSRIHRISDEYEKLCGKETTQKLKAVSVAASEGTQSVTRWTVVAALCIILFSIFFIGRDIIRNRKLQAQLLVAKENAERLAKTKEDFMANMSHEIRNPLNVISGFSRQLAKEELSDKNKKQAEGIQRSSEFLIALVNDILDISKVRSGKLQLEKIPFPLKDIRDDLENAFGMQAKEKGISFTVEIAKELPAMIIGDPVRFRQILFNIVSNAVKFTDKGFITVTFEQHTPTDGTKKLQIRVADSGIGIAKDKISTIFEEFEQADATITRKYGGTGLGLSITRVLVSEMKGTIMTKSEPGKGTTFTITLPLEAFSNGVTKNGELHFDKLLLSGKKILVCDDDPMNRLITAHLVKTYHADVIETCDGKETLDILSKEKVDLLLIDLEMPDMSGEETIALIRTMEEKNKNITKIIAVTGRNKEKFSNGKSIPADGYVQKPFKEADLLNEINRVLAADYADLRRSKA